MSLAGADQKQDKSRGAHMSGGYAGKILRLNLSDHTTSIMDTSKYQEYGGGIGMGTAIFWDLVENKNISAFDPKNVITLMTTPLSGTLAPAASARMEMNGIGPVGYPYEIFTRSNCGGRIAAELKFAGWDGIVIEGQSDTPVWVKIVNGNVSFENAAQLWGLDTWKTQQAIWEEMGFSRGEVDWVQMGAKKDAVRTMQGPTVLCIGPIGEVKCRIAAVISDAGHAFASGGFGAVWGAKNLKAISVMGTGGIKVADPMGLMEARQWSLQYGHRPDDPYQNPEQEIPSEIRQIPALGFFWGPSRFHGVVGGTYPGGSPGGPLGCVGCHTLCHQRTTTGSGTGSYCNVPIAYAGPSIEELGPRNAETEEASGLMQKYGINANSLFRGLSYLSRLHKAGILGKGKQIHTDLPFERLYKDAKFLEMLLDAIVKGEDIGLALREEFVRTAESWGRLEEDLTSGILEFPYYGSPCQYDARVELDWGFGSILGDRSTNDHDFNNLVYWYPVITFILGYAPVSAKECAEIVAEKMVPFEGDPFMIDFSTENMYSDHIVKLVAWHRRYSRFWKNAIGYCDMCYADMVNVYGPNKRGITPEGEPKFLKAVTGKDLSFAEGIEVGQKVWNIQNAIWALQGRHRDIVKFPNYLYDKPTTGLKPVIAYVNGEWIFQDVSGRKLDRDKFEDFKTRYYAFEGWDPKTGWPTRGTLEGLGLGKVADELERHGKLGVQ